MTKAQQDFRTREEDSRQFQSWYHNEDCQRILWVIYHQMLASRSVPEEKKRDFLPPYVFFDGIDRIPFDDLMSFCKNRLIKSGKRYFPILFKPEESGAHYISCLLRRDRDDQVTCFLFNPVGYPNSNAIERAKKKLGLISTVWVGGMRLVLSPHEIQSQAKDGEALLLSDKTTTNKGLVSCGPIGIHFHHYALNHPDWIDSLDERFNLPNDLLQYQCSVSDYRQRIETIRLSHDRLLGNLQDLSLQDIEQFYESENDYFIQENEKRLHKLKLREIANEDFFDNPDSDFKEEFNDGEYEESEDDLIEEDNQVEESLLQKPSQVQQPRFTQNKTSTMTEKSELTSSPSHFAQINLATTTRQSALTLSSKSPTICPSVTTLGLVEVQEEITRLESKTGCFSASAREKAQEIREALRNAQSRKVQDVRLDNEVRQALSGHRIFSFFGLKTAKALANIDESLAAERKNSLG